MLNSSNGPLYNKENLVSIESVSKILSPSKIFVPEFQGPKGLDEKSLIHNETSNHHLFKKNMDISGISPLKANDKRSLNSLYDIEPIEKPMSQIIEDNMKFTHETRKMNGSREFSIDLGVDMPENERLNLIQEYSEIRKADKIPSITTIDMKIQDEVHPAGIFKYAENKTKTERILDELGEGAFTYRQNESLGDRMTLRETNEEVSEFPGNKTLSKNLPRPSSNLKVSEFEKVPSVLSKKGDNNSIKDFTYTYKMSGVSSLHEFNGDENLKQKIRELMVNNTELEDSNKKYQQELESMRIQLILLETKERADCENKINLFNSEVESKLPVANEKMSVLSESVCHFNVYESEIQRLREEVKFISDVVQSKQKEIETLNLKVNELDLVNQKGTKQREELRTDNLKLSSALAEKQREYEKLSEINNSLTNQLSSLINERKDNLNQMRILKEKLELAEKSKIEKTNASYYEEVFENLIKNRFNEIEDLKLKLQYVKNATVTPVKNAPKNIDLPLKSGSKRESTPGAYKSMVLPNFEECNPQEILSYSKTLDSKSPLHIKTKSDSIKVYLNEEIKVTEEESLFQVPNFEEKRIISESITEQSSKNTNKDSLVLEKEQKESGESSLLTKKDEQHEKINPASEKFLSETRIQNEGITNIYKPYVSSFDVESGFLSNRTYSQASLKRFDTLKSPKDKKYASPKVDHEKIAKAILKSSSKTSGKLDSRIVPSSDRFNGKIDIVFCMDCTESMGSYISQLRNALCSTSNQILSDLEHMDPDVKFGFVGYRDYDIQTDSSQVTEIHDLSDPESCLEFISAMSAQSIPKNDPPEAVFAGLWDSLDKINWRDNEKEKVIRMLIHIADAPPHGKAYYNGKTDHFPKGDPCGINVQQISCRLQAMDISYRLVKIGTQLELMEKEFYKFISDMYSIEIFKAEDLSSIIPNMISTQIKVLGSKRSSKDKAYLNQKLNIFTKRTSKLGDCYLTSQIFDHLLQDQYKERPEKVLIKKIDFFYNFAEIIGIEVLYETNGERLEVKSAKSCKDPSKQITIEFEKDEGVDEIAGYLNDAGALCGLFILISQNRAAEIGRKTTNVIPNLIQKKGGILTSIGGSYNKNCINSLYFYYV